MLSRLAERPMVDNPKIVHGTINGYSNYKCRCEACSLWHKEYRSRQYQANKDREERNEILAKQGNRCGACGAEETTRRHPVDHNHTTGEIRGILCHGCNVALGYLNEDEAKIEGLLRYLKEIKS